MTVDPKTLVAAIRAEGNPPARAGESDLIESERRVREALRQARARQWERCHWWGIAREEPGSS